MNDDATKMHIALKILAKVNMEMYENEARIKTQSLSRK
ncbi:hypothetical protein GVAMD_0942 [Gardnerella vaginalis AMD]|nr:hypothetical protein GVAMD_0942 [Gardnerella vaginalis AMD]